MNIVKKTSIIIALLGILIAVNAFGNDTVSRKRGRRHHGPPPEAFAACEGKIVGDTAEFISPHGDAVTGTCEQQGDRLVLRPDRPRPHTEGKTGERQREIQN
jgi:hypothetical protein